MDKRLYEDYDRLVARCLPEYYLLLEEVVRALNNPRHIIDLGIGTGNLAELIFRSCPQTIIEGIDVSSDFLTAAANKCRDFNFLPKLADMRKIDFGHSVCDCIISSLAIHHFIDGEKMKLFEKIYQALKPGGIFVNLDMVKSKNYRQAVSYFLFRMKDNGLSADFIEKEKREMIERDRPVALSTQKRWLERIGFKFSLIKDIGLFAVYKCEKSFSKGEKR